MDEDYGSKMNEPGLEGIVFDIERFSIHDGPGIRTVVFLKGCPLKCKWCANPESQNLKPQLGFIKHICLGCGKCHSVCPIDDDKQPPFSKCTGCFACVEKCLVNARLIYGKNMTYDEVVDIVRRDLPFYLNSKGGVTLSGGESGIQPDFSANILKRSHDFGIHTAMETCGFISWENFSKILEHVDCLLYDLKLMNPDLHKKYTGIDNTLILKNAVNAAKVVEEMIIRVPVIPGVNDTIENFKEMGEFINCLQNVKQVDLLPYHSMGESKCDHIGRKYDFSIPYNLSDERIHELTIILESIGLTVSLA